MQNQCPKYNQYDEEQTAGNMSYFWQCQRDCSSGFFIIYGNKPLESEQLFIGKIIPFVIINFPLSSQT